MDAGFYRGTNTDQDTRFTDKEKKLLKQMMFEGILETKVDLNKINIDVIKPWITVKLNDILGYEDDVVIEYVFTQLEEQNLNPKVMQINLTGFLNARRSREFMGELWSILVEAQSSPNGIPPSMVEKKVQELKAAAINKQKEQPYAKATETDWKHRYQSLTGGRYGSTQPNFYSDFGDDQKREDSSDKERRRRDPDDDRDRYLERRVEREEKFFKGRKELLRERHRSSSPPVRRFTERKEEQGKHDRIEVAHSRNRDDSDADKNDSGGEARSKKKRKHRHHNSESKNEQKKSKKHKKDKKEEER